MEAEKESLNTPGSLSQEATRILRNFSQQCTKDSETYTLINPNPFEEILPPNKPPLASNLYRYRRWPLGEDISLVARTTLDAVVHVPSGTVNANTSSNYVAASTPNGILEPVESAYPATEVLFATTKVVNEFDSRAAGSGGAPDWRQKLDSQRGAVMASEIKNNGNKLARWTTEALLSGADQLRIGFVSRVSPRDRGRHVILGSAVFKPKEFAGQMNVQIGNGWGILKAFVDLVYKMDDGKYVMVKDPNKVILTQ